MSKRCYRYCNRNRSRTRTRTSIALIAWVICSVAHADDGALKFIDILGALTLVMLILTIGLVRHIIKRHMPQGQLAARHGWRYAGHERYEGGDTSRFVNGAWPWVRHTNIDSPSTRPLPK